MKRLMYVVARHEQKLYRKFTKAYTSSEHVEVVLDRRVAQRRVHDERRRPERRHDDRRWHDISKNLRVIGWAMVRPL
jgi:hypothetical protein